MCGLGGGEVVAVWGAGAVGLFASFQGAYDRIKQATRLESERPYVIRECIQACRKGGTIAMIGVYGGVADKFPLGALMNKALHLRTGQVHAQRYLPRLLEHVERGEVDPAFVATHEMSLTQAQEAYQTSKQKTDACVRVVFRPPRGLSQALEHGAAPAVRAAPAGVRCSTSAPSRVAATSRARVRWQAALSQSR